MPGRRGIGAGEGLTSLEKQRGGSRFLALFGDRPAVLLDGVRDPPRTV